MKSSDKMFFNKERQKSERIKQAVRVTINGLLVNLLLVILKIFAGIFGRSSAMIADGIHSLSDTLSDTLLLFGFRYVDRPPDKTHNYGHGKIETLLTITVSLIIIVTGFVILANSSSLIISHILGQDVLTRPNWIALVAAVFSIISKEILFRINKSIGEKTNNEALLANAWHHRSDSLSSLATLLGVGFAVIYGSNLIILDPIAAVLVSLFIIWVGASMIVKNIREMVETSIGQEKEKDIINTINSVEGVIGFHKLRTRKIGNYFGLDVHIEVNRYLNVIQAHDIATNIEKMIKCKFGENNVISVHIEPFEKVEV